MSAETTIGILTFLFGMTGFLLLLLQLGIQRGFVQQRRAADKGGVKWGERVTGNEGASHFPPLWISSPSSSRYHDIVDS